MTAQVWIAILVGLAAMIDDLSRRQIANWIPLVALAGGIGWQMGQSGWMGGLYALGGAAAGFGVFLIFYVLGGMGGGDIKLMAGFGALLGVQQMLWASFYTALVGGLLGLGVLGFRRLRQAVGKMNPQGPGSESIPYAPAIALGVWLSLVPKG